MKKLSIPRQFFLVLWMILFIHGVGPVQATCEEVDLDTRYCLRNNEKSFLRCNCVFERTSEGEGRWVCRGSMGEGNKLPDNKNYDCIEMVHDACESVCTDRYVAYPNFR